MEEKRSFQFIIFSRWGLLLVLLTIILGNLFIINIVLFSNTPKFTQKVTANLPKTTITPSPTSTDTCGNACKAEIKKEVALTMTKIPTTTSKSLSPNEFFITLGSGSNTTSDWEDVIGVQSYIDSTSYGKIKAVTFEASLYTPTGNQAAYSRLYNVTDKHPVWNSEVNIEGGTPQLKISSPITLSTGSKLYQVQMKTQLQFRTNLENARIHITTY